MIDVLFVIIPAAAVGVAGWTVGFIQGQRRILNLHKERRRS